VTEQLINSWWDIIISFTSKDVKTNNTEKELKLGMSDVIL
jgi:hypothetical protein